MTDIDTQIDQAFRQLDGDPIDQTGYYKEAFESFKGPGSVLRIGAIIGAIFFSAGLIICLFKMFGTNDLAELIRLGVFALLFGQAQIALKLWFNMQLNRRAITSEVRRLGLLMDPSR